jgi:hypothetical protein
VAHSAVIYLEDGKIFEGNRMSFDNLEFEAAYDIQRFTNIKDSNGIISNSLINFQPIIRVEGTSNYTEFYNSVISSILEYKNDKISGTGLGGY